MDVGFSLPYFLVPGYYLSRLACATTLFSPSLPSCFPFPVHILFLLLFLLGEPRRDLLLNDGATQPLHLGQRYQGLGALPNDEHVHLSGRELRPLRVSHVDNRLRARVLLDVDDRTHPTRVVAARRHHNVTHLKLDEVRHLVRFKRKDHRVVDLKTT